MTVITDSLARGLVRAETRRRMELIERFTGAGKTSLPRSFGPAVRRVRADIERSFIPVAVPEYTGGSHWQAYFLIDEGGDLFIYHVQLRKRRALTLDSYQYGINQHCRERMVQQGIAMPAALDVLRCSAALRVSDGWLATATALWRVNDGMLATVIEASRLIEKRRLWERMRKGATDTQVRAERDQQQPMGCAA